jgi:hypothetical protein
LHYLQNRSVLFCSFSAGNRTERELLGFSGVGDKKQPPNDRRRLEWVRHLIDCMDRCSQWPDQERPCPINGRVERVVGRIVMALSAEGQLIALLINPGTSAELGGPADAC